MAESSEKTAPPRVSPKRLAARYEKIDMRTERLDRLCDILPGVEDPMAGIRREDLIGLEEWESWSTWKRNRAVGFVGRDYLRDRHQVHPPVHFLPAPAGEILDRQQEKALERSMIVFRYKDVPMAALLPKRQTGMTPLLCLAPRMKTTPTEDLPVILNSRLLHFVWRHYHPRNEDGRGPGAAERLRGFRVPMLTKRTGGPFREARDEILALAERNSARLRDMDRIQRVAEDAGVPLVPLHRTEGIIREINVPRPLGEAAGIKRRGPVVIFRRGSTIVTTTEEAATYLELWLKQRFDHVRGMAKDQLEEFIRMPPTTAHIVVVLQRRARIEADIDDDQERIVELQREAEDRLYDLYGMTEDERESLRAHYA